jgi:hypothetical protein
MNATWGGKREGAGRPRQLPEGVRHRIGDACEKRAWARESRAPGSWPRWEPSAGRTNEMELASERPITLPGVDNAPQERPARPDASLY